MATSTNPSGHHYGGEQDRGRWMRQLFDHAAADYERIERLVGLGCGAWYRRRILWRAGLRPGMRALDVGLGTGLLAREIVRHVGDPGRVVGIDPSMGMLRAARVPAGAQRIAGCAERLPVADGSFDFVSVGYVLRYLGRTAQAQALAEIHRVLRPGGRACVLEMCRPQNALTRLAWRSYLRGIVPLAAQTLAPGRNAHRLARYLWASIDGSTDPAAIVLSMRHAGFGSIRSETELGIFAAYLADKPPA